MDSLQYIKRKYVDLIPRSFKTKLDIFLFHRSIIKGNLEDVTVQEFKNFKIDPDIEAKYQRAWQLDGDDSLIPSGITMKALDDLIEAWGKLNTDLQEELRSNYKILFVTEYFPFSEFEKIYDRDPKHRICHYCKKSDQELTELRKQGKILTKKLRGYTMEVDRRRANFEYSKENIVLACYWCNNAKTDEFSEDEFLEHIGPGIEHIWNDRAKNSSEVPL